MISIVMTTYNGNKYIKKQLESILKQTRLPDEVIICDDASTDNTVDLIEKFIKENKTINWYLYKNDINKNWRQNFYYSTSLAKGDIIFFSDQDDIWYSEKIEIMSHLMSMYDMGALYAEKMIIDENDKFIENRMEKTAFSGKVNRIPFANSFYVQKTLGCCMCVSRKIIDIYLRVNCPNCGHDSQCGRLALLYSSLWHLDKPLIGYRIHERNISGISKDGSFGQSTLLQRKKNLENDIQWIKILMKDDKLDKYKRNILKRCYIAMAHRLRYLSSEKHVNFFDLLKYKDCYNNIDMLIGDFAYKHNLNKQLGIIRWKVVKILKH